jgi:hypothetical protein
VEGEFQYTLPNYLSISVDEDMCLHPMFMRVFSGRQSQSTGPVVLPRGSRITDKDYRELS